MTFAKYFKKYLLAICLVIISALSTPAITGADQVDSLLSIINQQLVNGQIVVIYQMVNNDKTSEQYADWAYYLNDFASEHSATYQFHRANKAINDKLSNHQLDTSDSYTLFLKEGDSVYFYPDVILESMVYIAVDQAYAGHLSDFDRNFLPGEITMQLEDASN